MQLVLLRVVGRMTVHKYLRDISTTDLMVEEDSTCVGGIYVLRKTMDPLHVVDQGYLSQVQRLAQSGPPSYSYSQVRITSTR